MHTSSFNNLLYHLALTSIKSPKKQPNNRSTSLQSTPRLGRRNFVDQFCGSRWSPKRPYKHREYEHNPRTSYSYCNINELLSAFLTHNSAGTCGSIPLWSCVRKYHDATLLYEYISRRSSTCHRIPNSKASQTELVAMPQHTTTLLYSTLTCILVEVVKPMQCRCRAMDG